MHFDVPAGNALVFTGEDGALLATSVTSPLSRQVNTTRTRSLDTIEGPITGA